MFTIKNTDNFDDFFSNLSQRNNKIAYFYQVKECLNDFLEIKNNAIIKYYDFAMKKGVVIEDGISAPKPKQLSYYSEIMGTDFKLTLSFLDESLKKWLPRMNDVRRYDLAFSMLETLQNLLKQGKSESIIKNTYIKFMCWLYYKFERLFNDFQNDDIPKILYEGNISNHEFLLLSILSKTGCDVLIFPPDFDLKSLRENLQKKCDTSRLYGDLSNFIVCTNAWIENQRGLEIIKEPTLMRGKAENFIYNAFVRINGAEDKYVYSNDLYRLQNELKNSKRHIVIVNKKIQNPTTEEINNVKRENYSNYSQLILNISQNISYSANIELQKLMEKAFVDVILEESEKENANINKITSKAVYILCWLNRYSKNLFSNWKKSDVGVFIYFGGCKNENEALFLRFLSKIPVDVLILCPNLNEKCCLKDNFLYEEDNRESVNLEKYPENSSLVQMQTVASHAENEMANIMGIDSNGLYKNQQFSKANTINLQTMYEEIESLWDITVNLRQFFRIENNIVDIPVVFSKISGVKNGNLNDYWDSIRNLKTENSLLITEIPYIESGTPNKFKGFATQFYKNGKLYKEKIKNHKEFPYSILREDMQNHILDKIEFLIKNKLIKGIGENGTEYSVIGWCLNLPKEIVQMIQSFDFTKKNPKLIFVNTTDKTLSLEDSIIVSFLNLIGFDILFFVPTGFQCVEKYFAKKIMEEHQIGEYKYDLTIPDLNQKISTSLLGKLFGKR